MYKVRFILRLNKKDNNGACPVRMIISNGKSRAELTIPSIKIKPGEWDSKKERTCKNKLANLRLDDLQLKAENEIHKNALDLNPSSPKILIDHIAGRTKKKNTRNISADQYCMEAFAGDLKLAYGTRKNYKSIAGLIRAYDPKILLKDLDKDWLEGFKQSFIKKNAPKKWTIHSKIKCIKRLVNHAYQNKVISENKLTGFRSEKGKAFKKFLTPDEVKKLETFCKTPSEYVKIVKPFLWCCFTGMRFGDMACLKWGNITNEFDGHDHQYRLKYTMRKTNNEIDVVINKKAIAQLELPIKAKDETVFGVITKLDLAKDKDHISRRIESMNSYMNRLLKEACKKAGLERTFSWHESRHSFFCLGLQLGIDVMSLKEIGGHSDVKVTQEYLQVIDLQKKKAMLAFDNLE